MEKTCTACGALKLLTEFHRRGDGYRAVCKACRNAADSRKAVNRQPLVAEPVLMPAAPVRILPATPAALQAHVSVRVDVSRASVIVLLFDLHIPEHDPLFWASLIQFIREVQPDEIILGGDFLELLSCSMHGFNEGMEMFKADCEVGYSFLLELRHAAPRAHIVYLEGNHETRLTRFLMQKAPAMLGAITLREKLRLDELGIEWVPEDEQPIQRGLLDILHGHQLGSGARGLLPKYHTAKACDVYGAPGRTVVYGHVHYDQETGKTNYYGRMTARSFGCGRKLQPKWLQGSVSGWMHEFGVAYVGSPSDTALYAVKPKNGSFLFNGRFYAPA